jgi:quercetin dioxygenase-like cupin family protein
MPFFQILDIQKIVLHNGIKIRAIYGERISVSILEFPPFTHLPAHQHPNEQIGVVEEGELEYTIGGQTRLCQPGSVFVVPPNTLHSAVVLSDRQARVLDIFSPPRRISETEVLWRI